MTAADWGALAGGAAGVAVIVTLVWAVVSLRRQVRVLAAAVQSVSATTEDVRDRALPLLDDLSGVAGRTEQELVRMDGLLDAATSVTRTADAASRLAYLTFSNPVIKVLAFGAGARRAASRFRRRGQPAVTTTVAHRRALGGGRRALTRVSGNGMGH